MFTSTRTRENEKPGKNWQAKCDTLKNELNRVKQELADEKAAHAHTNNLYNASVQIITDLQNRNQALQTNTSTQKQAIMEDTGVGNRDHVQSEDGGEEGTGSEPKKRELARKGGKKYTAARDNTRAAYQSNRALETEVSPKEYWKDLGNPSSVFSTLDSSAPAFSIPIIPASIFSAPTSSSPTFQTPNFPSGTHGISFGIGVKGPKYNKSIDTVMEGAEDSASAGTNVTSWSSGVGQERKE